MKNIRHRVFETNSSSTHSISIDCSAELYDTILPDNDGVIKLIGGDFGWEWNKFNDALTKANYCSAFSFENKFNQDMLIEVVKQHTGAKEVVITDEGGYGIDHQSGPREGGDCFEAFDNNIALKNFIFSPKSWLFTGNDNECGPCNFYDVTDKDYTHELKLEGALVTEKLLSDKCDLEDPIKRILKTHPLCCLYNSEWCFRAYNSTTIEGVEFSSISRMSDGIIVLYKTESVYGKKSKWLGERIIESKELKFEMVAL